MTFGNPVAGYDTYERIRQTNGYGWNKFVVVMLTLFVYMKIRVTVYQQIFHISRLIILAHGDQFVMMIGPLKTQKLLASTFAFVSILRLV